MNVEPLRASLLAAVAADAARDLERVRAERAERVADAHRRADAVVADARRAGEQEGAAEVAHRLVRARREARRLALAAQREAYEGFRARALELALARRGTPEYDELLERLAETTRAQLGADAELERDPPDRGGILGRHGGRRVDYTLPALVDHAIAGLGTAPERLWE